MSYDQKLEQEAELWGSEAERMAGVIPPDWRYHKSLWHNVILHGEHISALLDTIKPGMRTLELGCASGWLTLAMAQRGADATGLDISKKSLAVARDYYTSIQDEVIGTAIYEYADLNQLDLAPATYDVVVVKGTLHHLVNMPQVIDTVHAALKPGGLFWIEDEARDVSGGAALLSSALMFILPTHVSYKDKIGGLLKFGFNAPNRIKASMEAEGLSPFEGAGRDHDWLTLVSEKFTIDRLINAPAVTGYITAQIKMPQAIALPFLRGLKVIDQLLVKLGLLKNSGVTVWARKPEGML